MTKKKLTIFLTGASSGLGFAIAKKLISEGNVVFATVRSSEAKNKLTAACGSSKNLHVVLLDLSNKDEIPNAVDQVLSASPSIDALIHNAGLGLIGPVDSATSEEVERLFQINVFAPIALTQLFLPAMRKAKKGRILFVGSIAGIESSAYQGIYSGTKFALEAIAASWATTLHKWNIHVTILEPGAMNTALPQKVPTGSYYQSQKRDPYARFNENIHGFLESVLSNGTEPEEVADLVQKIIQSPSPKFRYQTCAYSRDLVKRTLCDPDGDSWLEEHRKFVEQFY